MKSSRTKRLTCEFINRCKKDLETEVKSIDETFKDRRKSYLLNNLNKVKSWKDKYINSKKGKIANVRRNAISSLRYKNHIEILSNEEIEEIRKFYGNRPEGFEVDHIIPLSIGGRHHISNLQYLTKEENRKKGTKIDTDLGLEFFYGVKFKKFND